MLCCQTRIRRSFVLLYAALCIAGSLTCKCQALPTCIISAAATICLRVSMASPPPLSQQLVVCASLRVLRTLARKWCRCLDAACRFACQQQDKPSHKPHTRPCKKTCMPTNHHIIPGHVLLCFGNLYMLLLFVLHGCCSFILMQWVIV